MNGRWEGEAKGSWTAVSRSPYPKALTLLAKGDGWHGGGLFTGSGRYWLNDGHGHQAIRDSREVRRDPTDHPTRDFGGECPGVSYVRLMRDGWRLAGREGPGKPRDRTLFEKPAPGRSTLHKIAHEQLGSPPGRGCYRDEHTRSGPGEAIACPDREWAEVDGERLVRAAGGHPVAGRPDSTGLVDVTTLHDFNGMEFEPIPPPD